MTPPKPAMLKSHVLGTLSVEVGLVMMDFGFF
jgi:hypothetical protein